MSEVTVNMKSQRCVPGEERPDGGRLQVAVKGEQASDPRRQDETGHHFRDLEDTP